MDCTIELLPDGETERLVRTPFMLAEPDWEFETSWAGWYTTTIAVSEAGQIVGYMMHEHGYIIAIEVLESCRQQGIGRMLVHHLIANYSEVIASGVLPGAWGFWTALGFAGEADDEDWKWVEE